jgi:hypothetical protein
LADIKIAIGIRSLETSDSGAMFSSFGVNSILGYFMFFFTLIRKESRFVTFRQYVESRVDDIILGRLPDRRN